MLKSVILIIVGLTSTVVLAFASYQSKSGVVRVLFWTALVAAAGVIVYSGIETIRSERDLLLLKRETETISRFDVAAEVTLTGDWKSAPPDFSHYLRTGERGVNIRIELKTKNGDMRWVEFTDSSPPRIVAGERNSWVLDYTSHASAGSWVLGINRDDLQTCGTVVMRLYGIDYNATQDGVIIVDGLTLRFSVNGVPAYRCEYHQAQSPAYPGTRIASEGPTFGARRHAAPRTTDSSAVNAVSFSSACTTKRFPSPRCASAIQIVRP